MLSILRRRIKDEELLRLIGLILANHKTRTSGKGMPLGNLTSQFFANIYLSELDYFVKHGLKAKYYIRYVDDFVILERNRALLEAYMERIDCFLKQELKLELHPEKSKIILLQGGVTLLGFRVFFHYRLLKRSNQLRVWKRLRRFRERLDRGETTKKHVLLSMAGLGRLRQDGKHLQFAEKGLERGQFPVQALRLPLSFADSAYSSPSFCTNQSTSFSNFWVFCAYWSSFT